MSNYAKMLGKLVLEVDEHKIEITPKKGDARKLMKLQADAGEDSAKFLDDFIMYTRDLIVREESINEDDPAYEHVETFVELNLMDFLDQILVAFKLAEEGDIKSKVNEGFQKGLPASQK